MNNNLKLQQLEIENFKGIGEFRRLDINGRSFVIIAKNESGKSSLIDAIISPVNKKVVPSKPIKKGEERATIREVLAGEVNGEQREYTLDLHFTPSQQTGKLIVYNEKEEKIARPGQFLDDILGNCSFDVEEFLRGSRAEDRERRLKLLRQLTGKEKELDELDRQKKETVSKREEMSREIKTLDANVYSHGITDEEFQKYMNPPKVSPEEIEKELKDVQPRIDTYNKQKEEFAKILNQVANLESASSASEIVIKEQEELIKNLKNQIVAAEKRIETNRDIIKQSSEAIATHKVRIAKAEKWFEAQKLPDISEITDRLNETNKHMNTYKRIVEFQEKQQTLFKKKQEYENLSTSIDEIDRRKAGIIAKSNLPVAGLTFDESGIYLNGLPLESGQINSAKILEVGEEISMALNPGLKVLFVRDGSLYDSENLKRLVSKAESRGYQVIIEIVGDNQELEIKWTEDYFK
jgi:hypothetical protein